MSNNAEAELESCGGDSPLVVLATCPVRRLQRETGKKIQAASKILVPINMQLPLQSSVGAFVTTAHCRSPL